MLLLPPFIDADATVHRLSHSPGLYQQMVACESPPEVQPIVPTHLTVVGLRK